MINFPKDNFIKIFKYFTYFYENVKKANAIFYSKLVDKTFPFKNKRKEAEIFNLS